MPGALMSLGAALIIAGSWVRMWDRKNTAVPYCLIIGGVLLIVGQLSR